MRIYPTDEDIENFKKYIGYSRYLYNKAIDVQKEYGQNIRKRNQRQKILIIRQEK